MKKKIKKNVCSHTHTHREGKRAFQRAKRNNKKGIRDALKRIRIKKLANGNEINGWYKIN